MMSAHEPFIRRCFQLAKLGKGAVAPNPFVGAVIVHKGKVIGEGFHRKYGNAHAEVNAIQSVANKSLLSESTVYVNLEPCSFTGNTPPCADLLIEHKVKKVVISNVDPHEKVAGSGIARLQQAGIEVVSGILSEEGAELNKRFFTFHQQKRPYIILKWAQSQDGYLDLRRPTGEKGINWVSTKEAKLLTHRWRAEESAILVGRKTVEIDNPALTVREVSGINPLRVVLDPKDALGRAHQVFDDSARTIVYTHGQESQKEHAVTILNENYLQGVLDHLYRENKLSVIIEGGAHTLNQFISSQLWDEARIIVGPRYFGTPGLTVAQPRGLMTQSYTYHKNQVNIIRRT